MKYRIKITQFATLLLLVVVRPYSWKLFAAGMLLGAIGESIRIWSSGNLYKDKSLATGGPYEMTRNPLYVGSFLMGIGFCIACANPAFPLRTAALFLAVLLGFKFVYSLQVQAEEIHLANLFGPAYQDYKNRVPQYFPDLAALNRALSTNAFSAAQMIKNKELTTVSGFVLIAIIIACRIHFGI